MMKELNAIYRKQSFQPNLFSIFLNPFFLVRLPLYQNIKKLAPYLKGKILDFGCGSKPYRDLFINAESYIGIDIQNEGHSHEKEKVDVYYDGKKIPFADESFDAIFSTEVLEHVFNPEEMIPEIKRVLKKEGKFLLTVPFIWNEHEIPNDYARYTSFGLKHLLEKNGFEIVSMNKSGHSIAVIFQIWVSYLIEKIPSNKFFRMFFTLLFISPFNLLGFIFSCLLPNEKTIYFNNVFLVTKK